MNWQVLEEINSDNLGKNYKIQNKVTDEIAALKVLHSKFSSDRNKLRIKKKFFSASKIKHKNCVEMLEWYEKENDFGFIMEFVESVKAQGIASLQEKISKIIQICNGLEILHSKGIIHGNLKPENILCTADGIVKLKDFGLIKTEMFFTLLNENSFLDTVVYASPEQFKKFSSIDNRSDLYSLGIIFYELLTGTTPFQGMNISQIAFGHLESPIVFPENLSTQIPKEIELVVRKLLEKNPKNRFQSARELASKLYKFLNPKEQVEISGNYLLPPSFVGRENELKSLEKIFTQTQKNFLQKILICGENGIGKTKLFEEFQKNVSNKNAAFFKIKCNEKDNPYSVLQILLFQTIDSLYKVSDTEKAQILGHFAWDLTKILPQLSAMPFMNLIEKLPELSGKAQELRLHQATFDFIQNLMKFSKEKKSFVFLFDDIQNLDEKTFEWFENFIEIFKESQILIVGTCSEIQNRFEKDFQKIQLEPLEIEPLQKMLASILGQSEFVATEIANEFFNRSKGIPLLTETLVQESFRQGNFRFNGNSWELIFDLDGNIFQSENLEQILLEKLSNISDDAKNLLEVEAVLNSDFDFQTLLKLNEFEEAKLFAILDEVKEINLVTENYEFKNDKIKEILLSGLSGKREKNLHSKIGFFLESTFSGKEKQVAEKLAKHFTEARNTKKAIFYNDLAGEISKEKFAVKEALNYFQAAFELAETQKSELQKIKLLLKIAWALKFLSKKAEEQKTLEKARELALEGHFDKWIAEANIALATLFKGLRYFSQVDLLLEEALMIAQRLDDIYLEIEILKISGQTELVKMNFKKATSVFNKQLKLSEKVKYEQGRISSLVNLGTTCRKFGKSKKSIHYLKETLKTDDLLIKAKTYLNLGHVYFEIGNKKKAIEFYKESAKLHEKLGEVQTQAIIFTSLGKLRGSLGNFGKAIDNFEKAQRIYRKIRSTKEIAMTLSDIGLIEKYQGNYTKSIELQKTALKFAKENNLERMVIIINRFLGECFWEKGDFDVALKYFSTSLKLTQKFKNKNEVINCALAKIKTLLVLKNPLEAQKIFNKFFQDSFLKLKSKKLIVEIYKSKIAFELGKKKLAFEQVKNLKNLKKQNEILAFKNYTLFDFALKMEKSYSEVDYYRKEALSFYEKIYFEKKRNFDKVRIEELKLLGGEKPKKLLTKNSKMKLDNLLNLVTNFLTPSTAYQQFLDFLLDECKATKSQIITYDSFHNEILVKAESKNLKPEESFFSKSILEKCVKNNQFLLIENAVESEEFGADESVVGKIFLSVIAVPLRVSEKVIGALYLDRQDFSSGSFVSEDLEKVQKIADLLTPLLIRQEESVKAKLDFEIRNLGIFIGNSPRMQEVYKSIEEASKVNFTVCIQGEIGTGKELVAEALHNLSSRKCNFFVEVNCATIPKDLAESELFGYEKGAFTGATSDKKGKFELANDSTLFLDGIAELNLELQAKFIRVLQKKEVWRIGAERPISLNCRIIVATHKNLEEEVKDGNFREDLFHKLDVLKITVPPLRERRQDIPLLAYHLLERYSQELGKNTLGFTNEAIERMQNSDWLGNVKELENTIAKAIVKTNENSQVSSKELFGEKNFTSQKITVEKLSDDFEETYLEIFNKITEGKSLNEKIALLEKFVTEEALKKHNGNITHSAEELGIDTKRVRRILQRYGISKEQF
ncbi:MAG: hypothetical protein DWQ06_13935 [Calditrichaeota bacterium]|nr:MAG: hypothetical protein DWQ06_13935 [Calditrichota bacterium]